ncbi:hypothetical protein HanXRQr2_Chr09g0366821 [Helianthus annuus]|uniref:DUF674 family protein n=2 Tax=Helianthus annuus TaxID=4232 RepID=A0A251TS29_HELAN|nr:hypothetical protein HanXRQr2_Chr09g0366821 [Helianthus annuus]KAJ0524579.1 hypothetical protein HanHA300_Chr09g0302091 [Helianthus annuus]KAJ0532293.1 hypothetical protein HanIR_Chr09g0395111 [Helianthus annuus]KAJ0540844.1 hypothetical protein HanHA89_Chr09g0321451 [Helianthus annuus]KAJ0710060.1 hypothetical protein HanOQP8_Chr09g0307821 [Helianthus annuus]
MHPNQEIFSSCEESSFDQCDVLKKEVSATSTMLLKVFLQKSSGKLLFAETKEDFVEFLFGILSIPLGTVVGTLLNGASSISCMDNVFKSISNMSVGRYLMSQDIKDMLLKPHIGQPYSSKNQVFPLKCTPTLCEHVKDPRPGGNFLKQSGMFMVTDDLTITPSTSHSTIDVLRKLNVPLDDIERCEVSIGLEECLKLLKASLRSCSTLTDSLKHQLKK